MALLVPAEFEGGPAAVQGGRLWLAVGQWPPLFWTWLGFDQDGRVARWLYRWQGANRYRLVGSCPVLPVNGLPWVS